MSEWLAVAPVGSLSPGDFEVLETDDRLIAVFNVDGEFYAIEDICTHDGEELTGGPVVDDVIICPRHGASFCIRTGEVLTPPAYEDVATFPVRIHEGMIQVRDEPND